MKPVIFFITLFLGAFISALGQKNDYIWLTGYDSVVPAYDSTCQCGFGITKFDFNQSPAVLSYDSLGIDFCRGNSTMSDSTGNLLFYSNGVVIHNYLDQLIQNGDSLGWGPEFFYLNPAAYSEGLPFNQVLITLSNPQEYNIYDVFYVYIDSIAGTQIPRPNKLLLARLDMSANNGRGAVIEKDKVILKQDNDFTISAVRHGNGRDWWLCTNELSTNCHTLMLYTGADTVAVIQECSGNISPFGDAHACRFSPDGNYYITTNDLGQVDVFNFDRCDGKLNLMEEFVVPEIADSFQWWPNGLEFSPDSRFFYIFCIGRVLQYDLSSNPIVASKDTIATFHYPGHVPVDYFWGQLAPNGKIYINGGNSSYYLSVIDNPNGKGAACNFLDQSLNIHSRSIGLPYYPNYRLGPLTQSQCDSLSSSTEEVRDAKEQILKVFPNPANDVATIDYGFTNWSKGGIALEIDNTIGQAVYTQNLPMYSGFQQVNVSGLSTGLYLVFIKRNGGVVATGKLIKQ